MTWFSDARILALLAMLLAATPITCAHAGGPFITDDANTVDKGHFEIDATSDYTRHSGESGGTVAGLEVDYGLTEHLQAHLFMPLAFDHMAGGPLNIGIADVEIGAKYRVIDAAGNILPSVAVAPSIIAPSGDAARNLGTGSTHAFLPIWASRTWDKWTAFGGAGYMINPGPQNRDWVFTGAGATYAINPTWTIGAEVFYTTPAVVNEPGGAAFNIGAIYKINDTYHLMFSAGRNLNNAEEANIFSCLLGLQMTF
jgi:hypothetical protein